MKIVLATSNQGKLKEFRELFSSLYYHIIPQQELNVGDAEETGLTFVENAIIKARHAAECTGLPAIADDSGLVVPALQGEPGIYSARYAGKDAGAKACIEKLLQRLKGVPIEERKAYFHCTLVYMRHAKDPSPVIAQGTCSGIILEKPQGENGFGYNPVFFLPELNCTMAELDGVIKNKISHRGEALRNLLSAMADHKEIGYDFLPED
jgi:XTP/dITP diphosphohydrolase